MMRQKWYHLISIGLFVGGILTMTINSWNAKFFGLQNATVAALVEHQTFALIDQVIPGFNLVEGTETFRFGKDVFPMKQPGGTIIGAMIYYPLFLFKFTYVNHFDYVSHFVTWGTSTLMMALTSIVMYLFVREVTKNHQLATKTAIMMPLATIIWPYAGVSHHDIYGIFWSTLAIYTFYLGCSKNKNSYLWLAGFLATFTLFFTMLPLTLPLSFLILIAWEKNLDKLWTVGFGLVAGYIPNALFNWINFGNPLLPPNLAGQVSDTMPLLSLTNFTSKLWFYLGSPSSAIIYFAPVLLYGVIGIWQMKKHDWLKRVLTLIPFLQIVHISSMGTIGGFQYGPRYLLPSFTCLVLGIAVWLTKKHTPVTKYGFVIAVIYSIIVAAIGALQTVMYPMPGPYAPVVLGAQIIRGEMPIFRMLIPGLILTIFGAYGLYKSRLLDQTEKTN